MGVGGHRHATAVLPPGKDLASIIQETGWVPWQGQVRKILLPSGFDPQTVQAVAILTALSPDYMMGCYLCSS